MSNFKCRGRRAEIQQQHNQISEDQVKRNGTETVRNDVIRETFSHENKDLDF